VRLVARIKDRIHNGCSPARHIGRQRRSKGAYDRLCGPINLGIKPHHLLQGVHPGVSPSCGMHTHGMVEKALKGRLNLALYRAQARLNLPSRERLAVILQVQTPTHVSSRA
jgi:hypothetical protein